MIGKRERQRYRRPVRHRVKRNIPVPNAALKKTRRLVQRAITMVRRGSALRHIIDICAATAMRKRLTMHIPAARPPVKTRQCANSAEKPMESLMLRITQTLCMSPQRRQPRPLRAISSIVTATAAASITAKLRRPRRSPRRKP